MKVYISQPGLDERSEEALAFARNVIIKKLSELMETARDIPCQDRMDGESALHALGRRIQLMDDADIVVFESGWRGSPECIIEHTIAIEYGVRYIDMDMGATHMYIHEPNKMLTRVG